MTSQQAGEITEQVYTRSRVEWVEPHSGNMAGLLIDTIEDVGIVYTIPYNTLTRVPLVMLRYAP